MNEFEIKVVDFPAKQLMGIKVRTNMAKAKEDCSALWHNFCPKMQKIEEGEGYGPVDVDDFCHYLMEMDGKTSANFSVTRFAYGRGNYQRMEIYGSKGGLVYSLDVTPGVDELEVCFGYPYDRSGIYTKLPIPQRFQCDQMQSFADILNGCSDGMAATIQDGCRIQHALDVIIRSAEEEKWLPCD